MTFGRITSLTLVVLAAPGRGALGAERLSINELAAKVEHIAGQADNADANLRVVEAQYSDRPEPSEADARARRFSNGEIQYLLKDYVPASVLFYDLVSDDGFKADPRYPDALFYLSDSLYQQRNFLGARLYLRQLIELGGKHTLAALVRYLEIAGQLNEFAGIDDYVQRARSASGELPDEVAYVYGKWMFKRPDLRVEERLERARAIFAPLSSSASGRFALQAAYFLGVGEVKLKRYDAAAAHFQRVIDGARVSRDERARKLGELALLSMGRVHYESGRFDEALAVYQLIPRDSEYFPESLYEVSWTHVRKREHEAAKNATDILLLVAPSSTLAPEAQILQGHLLLKLRRFDEASETYTGVINAYAPVRDEVHALLTTNQDPVRYFDNLLARNERNLDVTSLLPPVALKWATTQREVSDAVRLVDDLETGRHGVKEADGIVARILGALDEHAMESFPELQEGYIRAGAVHSSLTQIEASLVAIETAVAESALSEADRAQLSALQETTKTLAQRFESLPKNEKDVLARASRMRERVTDLDKVAFQLVYELQSMYAVLAAFEKWVHDTRPQRTDRPEDEKAFLEKIRSEGQVLAETEGALKELRALLGRERELADAVIGGDDKIRRDYEEALAQQRAILERARAAIPPEGRTLLGRIDQVRGRLSGLAERIERSKGVLRERVARRGEKLRQAVLAEQARLARYSEEISAISVDARHLVGRIAFDSFRRVRQQFHDLVLKADVGLVDVAFTKKQDKTSNIQQLSAQKDRELRALDQEFQEVLKDVD